MIGEGLGQNTIEFGEGEEEGCGVEDDRGNKRPIDWFDELPDSLLIHILSFLNVKKAAVTSVLSKRWEFLWAQLPRLKFSDELPWLELRGHSWEIDKVHKFVAWVNRTLAIRTVNYLEEFRVNFIYHKCFASNVDAWIQFAVKNKVKILDLHLRCWDDVYRLPQVLYSCSSMTKLFVNGCIMDSESLKIEWQSLTHLYLREVGVDQRLLDEILSGCPVLYDVDLERCGGFDRVEVNSPSLHSLSVTNSEYEDLPLLKISAPYLHSLDILLIMEGRKVQLENISSLDRVDIDYNYEGFLMQDYSSTGVMTGAKQLLENTQHVKLLHVGMQFIEVVSMMVLNGWKLPQSRRERLIVASASEYEHLISGIIAFLESSPNLKTLELNGQADGQIFNLGPAAKGDLDGDLLHLKTIKIRDFADRNGEPLLTLARILLGRAPDLEEMTIVVDVENRSDFINIGQTLLTYPRSSTKVKIYLYSRKWSSL